jgi:hypothetical protein
VISPRNLVALHAMTPTRAAFVTRGAQRDGSVVSPLGQMLSPAAVDRTLDTLDDFDASVSPPIMPLLAGATVPCFGTPDARPASGGNRAAGPDMDEIMAALDLGAPALRHEDTTFADVAIAEDLLDGLFDDGEEDGGSDGGAGSPTAMRSIRSLSKSL